MFGDLSSEMFSTKRNWLVIEKLTVTILSDGCYCIEKLTLTYNKHSIRWFLQASSLDSTIYSIVIVSFHKMFRCFMLGFPFKTDFIIPEASKSSKKLSI